MLSKLYRALLIHEAFLSCIMVQSVCPMLEYALKQVNHLPCNHLQFLSFKLAFYLSLFAPLICSCPFNEYQQTAWWKINRKYGTRVSFRIWKENVAVKSKEKDVDNGGAILNMSQELKTKCRGKQDFNNRIQGWGKTLEKQLDSQHLRKVQRREMKR